MQVIQAVLAQYGSYSAALEREYIRSQQRPPEPYRAPVPIEPRRRFSPITATELEQCLRESPGAWTLKELGVLLGVGEKTVWFPMQVLLRRGAVLKLKAVASDRGRYPSMYQWKEQE